MAKTKLVDGEDFRELHVNLGLFYWASPAIAHLSCVKYKSTRIAVFFVSWTRTGKSNRWGSLGQGGSGSTWMHEALATLWGRTGDPVNKVYRTVFHLPNRIWSFFNYLAGSLLPNLSCRHYPHWTKSIVGRSRLRACLGSLGRWTTSPFFVQAQPENHRVAVSTGSFSGKAWAEKGPGAAFEEILNRLLDDQNVHHAFHYNHCSRSIKVQQGMLP